MWPNDWAVFWVFICMVHLTLCFCHVTYAFQSKSTLQSCLNVKEIVVWSRCEIWSLCECNWTRMQNHLVCKRTLNHHWAMFWVLICAVHLTVCFCHVTYMFQSKSILYSCLNVKEVLAQSRWKIWSLSDCNWTWTQNHLVRKWTLNQTRWYMVILY